MRGQVWDALTFGKGVDLGLWRCWLFLEVPWRGLAGGWSFRVFGAAALVLFGSCIEGVLGVIDAFDAILRVSLIRSYTS